jgi:uncharacterized protein
MRPVRDVTKSKRVRALVLLSLGALLVLFLSASGIAQIYTDWLWFSHLNLGSVWSKILGTQILMVVVFTTIFFLILWGNLYLADRLAPSVRPDSPEEDLIERYHQLVGPHTGKIRLAVAAVFALVAGVNTAGQWETWLLFNNGESFGWVDPLFNKDASYYVFRLPFWTFLIDWFFAALVFALLVSLIAHYLNGGIRAALPSAQRVSGRVKVHVSALLAVLAGLRAAAYWLDRFELVNSKRGVFDGALATDVEVQLPALNLLALISIFGGVLFVVNIWRRGWGLPVVAVGLWAVSHLVVGGIYPSLYQRLRVVPEQSTREQDYITSNIDASRFAYGLDAEHLTRETYSYDDELTMEDVANSAEILDDVALVDATLATENFTRSQGERQVYSFSPRLDIDRYRIDGDLEPVVLSVRGLNLDGVVPGWENQHIAFTHGYGAAVAAGDRVDRGGQPDYLVSGVGPVVVEEGFEASLSQPQVYFSEGFGGYAIVGASRDEVDFPSDDGLAPYRYDGEGAVPIGSFFRRLAFALRFQQLDPLISNFVTDESQVIYNRDIESRVRQLAPFLDFDSDPYPVLIDNRVKWVIDGYTTTDKFPYAQSVDTRSVLAGADLRTGYNYVRNSVKAVVDGYDGTVTFYVIDSDDPLIAAWAKSFPDLFTPADEIPAELEAHFRYPVDIFNVQSDMWATYQVSNPVQFLQGDLAWSVATQPTTNASGEETTSGNANPMVPQYRVTVLPGGTEQEFIVQRAFVPRSGSDSSTERPELTSVLVARSSPGHYGELIMYDLPSGQVPAPDLVNSDIQKESAISEYITPLDLQGSTVLFGEMQMVLLADTVLYVRPLYVEAQGNTAVPELNRIIAVNGERIAMAETLAEAVAGVTVDGTASVVNRPPTTNDSDPAPDVEQPLPNTNFGDMSIAELISSADELLARAQTAADNGNETEAEELRSEARAALERASELLGIELRSPVSDAGEA